MSINCVVLFSYPEKNHIYCTETRCTLAICLSYLLPILLCSPTYFMVEIRATGIIEDNQPFVLYHTQLSEMAAENDSYVVFNFWMYAVVIKLLPCCILTVISIWLIRTLFKVRTHNSAARF